MADLAKRLEHNRAGDFFVDSSCIDCDTCRWMAPETFTRREGQASVLAQPGSDADRKRALMALLSCPTASIGTVERHDLAPAIAALPDEIAAGVYHCGFHSEQTFGAASYLIRRPEGNVLVDVPRFTKRLASNIEALGGLDMIFLSHRDDVFGHEKWAKRFEARRVMHEGDVDAIGGSAEIVVRGEDDHGLGDDLVVIPTPGHTRGSACLLFRDEVLFTGDHIAWSKRLEQIYAFRAYLGYDWGRLIESTRKLLDRRFELLLPGHGRACRFEPQRMRAELERGIAWMDDPQVRAGAAS